MSETKKKKKKRKKPLKHRFQSICVFSKFDVGKEGEFVAVANKLEKILTARKIHFLYGGGI